MNRLVIKQNTVTENITSELITKLYTEAKLIKDYEETNLILDNLVELQGNLLVPKAYDDEITYLETKFPNLHINTTIGRYIRFEDSTIQLIMALNFGDGIGITTIEAATVNGYNSSPEFFTLFLSNANIISFNELKYFTNTTRLRYNTFLNCTNLESIDLRNVTRIEQLAFRGCTKLKHILNYQNVQEWGYEIFSNCDLTGDYDFSASVAINNDRALGFSNNIHLTSVVMPTGVLKLCLFNGCTSLHTVSNTDDIIDIIYNAFEGCTALKNVSFPNASIIGNNAFKSSGIESISLPSLVTHNKANLFSDCSLLTSVNLPNLQTTGDNTFYNCSSLTQISLPSLISMGNNTFKGCSKLTTVSIPQCSVIKSSTFLNCSKLTSIDLSNCTNIGDNAFQNCSSLTSVDLSNCIFIGNNTFLNCSNLKTLEVSDTVTIGNSAFNRCQKLEKIFDSNITSANIIFSGEGANAFIDCNNLVFPLTITISSNSTSDNTYGDWLYRAFLGTTLYNVILDSSVKGVSQSAFYNTHLTSITAPYLQCIGGYAFSGVDATTIELPNLLNYCTAYNVTKSAIFTNCPNLQKVTLGHFVGTIERNSDYGASDAWFYNTPNLKIFDVGDSITEYLCNHMGGNFRESGSSLEKFIIRNTTVPTLNISLIPSNLQTAATIITNFGGNGVRIYVPDSALNDYKTATNWSIIASYIYPLSDIES